MKVHLFQPGENLTMCGRSTGHITNEPDAISCETCKQRYQNNTAWYDAAVRRVKHGVCENCDRVIETMAFQKTKFCSYQCEKEFKESK